MFFSMYQGGITPRCGPIAVRCLIARAYGRTSSYVTSGIGATPSGRWQFWQLRWRIGAMSLVNVTWAAEPADGCCAFSPTDHSPMARHAATAIPSLMFRPLMGSTGIATLLVRLRRLNLSEG